MGHPVRDHACLSSIDWGFLWQGHQEVMARLARAGGRVLYVENTGVRRPRLGDWPRLVRRFVSWSRAPSGRPDPMTPGLHVLSPVVLPFPWSPIARAVNRTIFAERLPAMARRRGLTAPVVWTFLPTPLALDVMRAFRSTRSLSVYYCIADFAQLADNPAAATWSEDALLGEVDLVFVDGRLLTDRLSRQHPRVRFAPFGVAEHFFSPPAAEPTELSAIPRPRVGYVGGLHRHVDAGLLRDVVAALLR